MSKPSAPKGIKSLIDSGLRCAKNDKEYAQLLRRNAKTATRKTDNKQIRVYKALADITRIRILRLLQPNEMCVCEVMVSLNLTQPTTSHHLGKLENAGLVTRRKEGKWVFYSLSQPETIQKLLDSSILEK